MTEKRPTAEQLEKYKKNAKNESFSADVRATFQSIVDKFDNIGKEVESVIEKKKETKPTTKKLITKVVATKQSKNDIELAKAEIKKRTGKTEEECESIVNEYRSLRAKSQERKKKEAQSTEQNKERVTKLKENDKIIVGTNEKTADAVIESTTKEVGEKIVKEITKIEQKAEVEAIKEVKKEMPKESTTEQNKAIAEKVEEKVKKETKTIVKTIVIDTSALLTTIAESLGKFDKDSQKEFLIKLRSDIDKLLSKYSYGGNLMNSPTQTFNITQSNMSASSVNPTLFNYGGGVKRKFMSGGSVDGFNGDDNSLYFSTLSKEELNILLQNIANHYGVTKNEIYAELTDFDSYPLYEYVTDESMRMEIYKAFQSMRYKNGGKINRKFMAGGMNEDDEYFVNVGNIGNISADTLLEARMIFDEYVEQSKSGFGRAGNEYVGLFKNGEPILEHFGEIDEDEFFDEEEFAKGGKVNRKFMAGGMNEDNEYYQVMDRNDKYFGMMGVSQMGTSIDKSGKEYVTLNFDGKGINTFGMNQVKRVFMSGGMNGETEKKMSYEDFVETLRDNDLINTYTGISTTGMKMYYLPNDNPYLNTKFNHKNKMKAYKEYLQMKKFTNGGGVDSMLRNRRGI